MIWSRCATATSAPSTFECGALGQELPAVLIPGAAHLAPPPDVRNRVHHAAVQEAQPGLPTGRAHPADEGIRQPGSARVVVRLVVLVLIVGGVGGGCGGRSSGVVGGVWCSCC